MRIEQAPVKAVEQAGIEPLPEHTIRGDKAIILHTQRLSTEDGPGIRTTVFFKGCPLNCLWCHNPESISFKPQMHWMESRCIGCGICLKTCPNGCLTRTANGIKRDREKCLSCGRCAQECPAGAQEMLGKTVGQEELLKELLKDKVYYDKSGGGITLSGGEPLMQAEFCAGLLSKLKENGIHTAVDTCGMCSTASLEKVLPFVDLILFDLKEIHPEKHLGYTGHDNRRILENLIHVRDYIRANPGKQLWIRTPLIPEATAEEETVERIGRFIHNTLENDVQRWELCAFNNLCRDKYRRLDMEWKYATTPLMSKADMGRFETIARGSGPDPDKIFVTGAARVENTNA
ncbi:MAG: glycyl-radical enzyme activating protein [Dehalococcoidia bacterium]|nr:glycyl-radical enzyme activating protein [Dehalococcoidia bacterium]